MIPPYPGGLGVGGGGPHLGFEAGKVVDEVPHLGVYIGYLVVFLVIQKCCF